MHHFAVFLSTYSLARRKPAGFITASESSFMLSCFAQTSNILKHLLHVLVRFEKAFFAICTFCRPVATPSNTRRIHQDSISLSHSYTFASAIHFSAHNLHFAVATGRKPLLSYCLMPLPTDCHHQGTAPPRRPQHAWFSLGTQAFPVYACAE